MVWHPDMDVRCGIRTARLVYKELYCTRRSDVRTMNGFVLPQDRGLEYASLKELPKNLGDYNCLLIGI